MKKLTSFLILSIFLFTFAIVSSAATTDSDGGTGPGGDVKYKNTNVSVTPGDILVTKDFQIYNDFPGHSAIVVDSNTVVEILGYGYTMQKSNLQSWLNDYPNAKVVRLNDSAKAAKAAKWAVWYYENYASKVKYSIDSKIAAYDTYTYCSKLVWDAYYFGGSISLPYADKVNIIIQPYDFVLNPSNSAVGLKTILTFGNW
ncbi:YiiX/YebB-like N1pC/P60 family cysteine hydrolase [Paenibacillus chitinolyticus]|uniref:YiiX/YebB-like N1pC/P60 family cysteine hydrolase n=1 Tax=Paenibacillus chitinolyticus TaxID=79263 RepID=UPI00366ABE91